MSEPKLPGTAVVVTHEVADWTKWKMSFDAHESERRAAGILGHHVNRGLENPNVISLYLAIGDVAKFKAFMASPELRQYMTDAGVVSAPTAIWMKPVLEQIVWDRELPGMIVSHAVADFDVWLAGYKAAAAMQKQGGIIGHAVNRSMDDPKTVIIYHQAETHDALKAFMAAPGLKAAMEAAGVVGVPQVSFHTGGWGKMY